VGALVTSCVLAEGLLAKSLIYYYKSCVRDFRFWLLARRKSHGCLLNVPWSAKFGLKAVQSPVTCSMKLHSLRRDLLKGYICV
jgi:hypothetical protein